MNSSAVHQSLVIQEVVRNICSFLVDSGPTLCALARCTKAFHEVAVPILWKDVPNLIPLLRCFPERSCIIESGEFRFVHLLGPRDWDRVLHYSQHVRRLGVEPASASVSDIRITDRSLLELSAFRPQPREVFPKLRAFFWRGLGMHDEHLPIVLTLLGPGLRQIVIGGWALQNDRRHSLAAAVSYVAERFSLTSELELSFARVSIMTTAGPRFSSALALVSQSLTGLTTFVCGDIPLTDGTLVALGHLPALVQLAIRLPSPMPYVRNDAATGLFQRLERLAVTTKVIDYNTFSLALKFPTVTAADVRVIGDLKQHDITMLFSSIARQFSAASLVDLSVSSVGPVNANVAYFIQPQHIGRLFVFNQLRKLHIGVKCRYQLHDALYSKIPLSWPYLRSLSIGAENGCLHKERPSVQSLSGFAAHCPDLEVLEVCFDATHALSQSDVQDALPFASNSLVHSLNVLRSPIAYPEAVAAYLARIFPKLCTGNVCWGKFPSNADGRSWQSGWEEVKRHLPWK
ncbi:hypothetical protein OH76DRAFT_1343427 [Lentinus brumalis]|uniref:F-box domain-containing protein n=1 Tax=Lentinus brumalis TaxID=2498619 RepID=A0A371DLL8_9APHY|nr:hypothetical protein OH76DRAFT_1343427 [Polyporus brumalis]